MSIPERIRITAAEYHASTEYDENDLIELIDGEVVLAVPPIPKYQRIVREILVFLTLDARQHGREALDAPIAVHLDEYNSFEPDVLYIRPDSGCDGGFVRQGAFARGDTFQSATLGEAVTVETIFAV